MLTSADIKRDIIKSADSSVVKKRMEESPPSITEGEQIEIGNNLEAMTKTLGWGIIEEYMLTRMNLVGMATSEKSSDVQRGTAKGFIELMQWIQLCIKRKNFLLEREKAKYEAENVSQDEID